MASEAFTRIGVIGDVHAESTPLQTALEFLQDQFLDAILCTGDLADGPGNVDTCRHLLMDNHVFTVMGNHDQWLLAGELRSLPDATLAADLHPETREYLRNLPLIREFETPIGPLLLCHGIGSNTMRRITPDDYGYALESNLELQTLLRSEKYRFMVNGHTHQRMVRRFHQLTVINAGTLLGSHQPCFLTIDIKRGQVQYYNFEDSRTIKIAQCIHLGGSSGNDPV
jgi:putative phosphoesterase